MLIDRLAERINELEKVDVVKVVEPTCPHHGNDLMNIEYGDPGLCQFCRFMLDGKKLIATFTPQAWINDNAIETDAEGSTEWDVTAAVFVAVSQEDDNLGLDPEDWPSDTFNFLDKFKADSAAPEWIREWSGPFEIHISLEEGTTDGP